MSSPSRSLPLLTVVALTCLAWGCASGRSHQKTAGNVLIAFREGGEISIRAAGLLIRLSPQQSFSASLLSDHQEFSLSSKTSPGEDAPSDYVTISGNDIKDFEVDYSRLSLQEAATPLGDCQRVEVPSRYSTKDLTLERVVHIDLCPAFPRAAILSATYRNLGRQPVEVERVVQVAQTLDSSEPGGLWTFQGVSLFWGRDNVFALPASMRAENPMGQMLPGGTGGGIPVNDFWNSQVGTAIGHVEPEALACWMPVETLSGHRVRVSLETRPHQILIPQATLSTPRALVIVHRGDYYAPLSMYGAILRAQGVTFPKPTEDLYQPVWWTYAFGHNFRPAEVYHIVPKLQELGIRWIIVNNRWWDHYGDWRPREDKFGGEPGFKTMLARLHDEGLKSILWWLPYGVQIGELPRSGLYNDPVGRPKQSPEVERMTSATAEVALRHRDWLIEDPGGKLVPISRNLAALCPAYPPARDYMVELARHMIENWKADGFYMDVVYTVPACYNPAHHHTSPYDSVRQLGDLFRRFRGLLEQYNPSGMLMICPCGTTMNHCLLSATNNPDPADPVGSEQIRWRVKMYKALMGASSPAFADRVESTQFQRVFATDAEVGRDFASLIGTGGIPGTIFIWPKVDKLPGDLEYRGEPAVMELLVLTPEKARVWKKWFDLYHEKMLSNGEFLDLYTVGFDSPEGYAVRKNGRMYYAFFAPAPRPWGIERPPELPELRDRAWKGRIELRGLDGSKQYRAVDYEHGKELGHLEGSDPHLEVAFSNHLLLEVAPTP